jgi:hypothetical protein
MKLEELRELLRAEPTSKQPTPKLEPFRVPTCGRCKFKMVGVQQADGSRYGATCPRCDGSCQQCGRLHDEHGNPLDMGRALLLPICKPCFFGEVDRK